MTDADKTHCDLSSSLSDNSFNQIGVESQRRELEKLLADKENEIKALRERIQLNEAELDRIYNSHGWALLLVLYRIRKHLIPSGSVRERLAWSVFRAVKKLWRYCITISSSLGATARRLIVRSPCKLSSPDKYDLFIFPISNWDSSLQQPRQIAFKFAQAGHRVFYVSQRFTANKSAKVKRIEDNLFELTLAGDPGICVSQRQPSPNTLKKTADCLGKFCLDNNVSTGVSLVQSSFWAGLAEELRARFGWPIVHDSMDEVNSAIVSAFPKVSIIVVMHNNLRLNELCLSSILRKTDYPNYEVILVDNASTDGSREFALESAKNNNRVRVILNDDNESFAKANNRALDSCSGDYVIFLNNDTIVTRGWITRFLRHLNSDASIGMIGPVSNAVGNEALIDVSYTSPDGVDRFAEQYCTKHDGETFEISTLALFCAAIKRSVLEDIGRLDERYDVGMFEDDDLCMRIQKAGFRLVCTRDVFIHHFQQGTFKLLDPEVFKRIYEVNRRLYEDKWGPWRPHQRRKLAG